MTIKTERDLLAEHAEAKVSEMFTRPVEWTFLASSARIDLTLNARSLGV